MNDPRFTDESMRKAVDAATGAYGGPTARMRAALEAAMPLLAPQPDMCHNGHPFEPGVDTDMVFESRDGDPRWCNTCGEARPAFQRPAPEAVSRAALISMFLETFDKGGLWAGLEPEAYRIRHRTKWATAFADAVLALLNGTAK